jgi:hypothetical protein
MVYYAYIDVSAIILKHDASLIIKEKRNLCVLRLSQQQFNATNKEEIYVDGALYDVQSYTVVNEQVHIVAYRDVKEETFLDGVADMFNTCNVLVSDTTHHQFSHVVPPHFNDAKYFTYLNYCIPICFAKAPLNSSSTSSFLPATFIDIQLPPPKA